jgi:GNAT superfamily N-acetyltransferase
MNYRIAKQEDFEQLARLRWDFRMESGEEKAAMSKAEFVEKCLEFFEKKSGSDYHFYWIAEENGEIIAQVFVHKIDMIPRPCKIDDQFGYVTNNYTKPEHRGQGIGSKLMARVIEWAQAEDLELLIVYPSERAVPFYERAGFRTENDVMELALREFYSDEWVGEIEN